MKDPVIERATVLIQLRQWDEAERQLRQALVNNPQAAYPHSLLALVLLEKRQLNDASELAGRAILLDPEEAFGHYTMALVMMRRDRYAEAIPPIEEAIRINPFDPRHFAVLGNIKLEQRNWQAALDAANRGLELDPTHDWCVNIRGMALAHLGQRAAAVETMKGALERDPENATTHANQGWALLHQNEPRKAMEHFREALRLNPSLDFARAGIVEAMKARNPIYRLLLMYFLFMARQSGRMQMFVVIGGYIGYRGLLQVKTEFPGLSPVVLPLIIAYVAFALSTWLAPSLMNIMLRFDRFGRYALSKEQTWSSNLIAILLLAAIGMFVASFFITGTWLFTASIFTGLLAIPASTLFFCEYGWPRLTALAIVVALVAIGAVEVFQQAADPERSSLSPAFYAFTYGILISSFLMGSLVRATVKK